MRNRQYRYIGPPAQVLLLPDGYKVVSPGTSSAAQVAAILENHPAAKPYWEEVVSKKASNPNKEKQATTEDEMLLEIAEILDAAATEEE